MADAVAVRWSMGIAYRNETSRKATMRVAAESKKLGEAAEPPILPPRHDPQNPGDRTATSAAVRVPIEE